MQYILVNEGQVVWGPTEWNRNVFQSEVEREVGIIAVLPQMKTDNETITLGNSAKIMAAAPRSTPTYHPLHETLAGPFWSFGGDVAEYWYEVQTLSLETAKPNYDAWIAKQRWERELDGTTATVGGLTVKISTKREDRDQWSILYALGNTKTWKFAEGWVELSKDDFKTIADAIHNHVQQAYDTELRLLNAVSAAETISDLLVVEQDDTIQLWMDEREAARGIAGIGII